MNTLMGKLMGKPAHSHAASPVFSRRLLLATIAVAGICTGVHSPSVIAQESEVTPLEEIVVTARRREENLQEVPVAVAVVDAAAIEARNIQSIDDVARFVPGLSFSKAFGRATERPVVRGLGNVLAGVQFGVESGAAYFVDGVYYPGDIQGLNLNDLDRVEVVKGPQSALYGRNSYSGAINFVTKSPGDELGGDVKASFAEDGEHDLRVTVSGPLVPDVLGGSLSMRSYEFDGQWDNQVTGDTIGDESTKSLSGVLEWTPSDRLAIKFRAQYQEDDDGTRPLFLQDATQNNCLPGERSIGRFFASRSTNKNQYYCGDIEAGEIALNDKAPVNTVTRPDVPSRTETVTTFRGTTTRTQNYAPTDGTPFDGVERDVALASMLLNYDIGGGFGLSFSAAYREEELKTGSDSDHSAVNHKTFEIPDPNNRNIAAEDAALANTASTFAISELDDESDYSMELRMDSPQDEALRWTVGSFYYKQEVDNETIKFSGPNELDSEETVENMAFFGSIAYDFTDQLTATAEIRRMEENKTVDEFDSDGKVTFKGDDDWNSTNPRITVDYQHSDNLLLYGSYAEGAKPGGFNGALGQARNAPTYEQEESETWELGVKSTLMDGRLLANISVFMTDVTDVQLTTAVQSLGSLSSIATNQGAGEVFGIEAELTYRAMDNLIFGFNYAFADTEFTEGCDEFQWVLTSGGGGLGLARWRVHFSRLHGERELLHQGPPVPLVLQEPVVGVC